MDSRIILPEDFKRPRYLNDGWYSHHTRWSEEDLTLLAAACDLQISYTMAANTLGRPPSTLVHKAFSEGIRVPRAWKALLPQKPKAGKLLDLDYPYIVKPDDRHADLIAVNRMVSKQLPGREDVCQDIMLALWQSRTSLAELRTDPKAVRAFVSAFRKASFERSGFGVESMDVTLHSDDGDGKSKYEDARYQRELVDREDEIIEEMTFGERSRGFTRDFAGSLVDQLSREEESLGVPAAMWMRAEILE